MFSYKRHVARAVIFNKSNNKFLLARGWFPPWKLHTLGGGIKKTEDPQEALLRELYEEVGLRADDISSIDYLGGWDYVDMMLPHAAFLYFVALTKDVPISKSFELISVCWVEAEVLYSLAKWDPAISLRIKSLVTSLR